MLLDAINGPEDLQGRSYAELDDLCEQIRHEVIEAVNEHGGHLGSNLGAVELSIALHRVFRSPHDAILWDTGHQAYVHKMLTGRLRDFSDLRQAGGLSGYPSREMRFMTPRDSTGLFLHDETNAKVHRLTAAGDTRFETGSALTNQDISSQHFLSTITLNTQAFGIRIATVTSTTTCFLMSHFISPRLAFNSCYLHFSVPLTMTSLFHRMLTTTKLHDFNFLVSTLVDNFSSYFATVNIRCANFNALTFTNHQYVVKHY